jgi:hypothetical protein
MKSKNTIELNGNLYDATTGKMLGPAHTEVQKGAADVSATTSPIATPATVKTVVTHRTAGVNIDGIFKSRTGAPATAAAAPAAEKISVLAAPAPAPKPNPKTPRTNVNHARAHQPQASKRMSSPAAMAPAPAVKATPAKANPVPVNHAKAHKPQSAVTLMRAAVKRPDPSLKAKVNVQTALTHQTPGRIEVKQHADKIDTDRLVRASAIETSPMVAHHGKQVETPSISVVPLAVKPVPVKPEGQVPNVAPAPQPTNKPQDQNIFDHALANATHFKDVKEHRTHFRRHTRNHVASMAAGTLALLVIAGFATYQNAPSLQFKVASMKAGVATTMPQLKSAGFAYNGARAQNGKLTVGFSNNSGKYQLTQEPTNWSSSDMIQDISATDASGRPNYTTVQAGGTTVYRFNNTNATWVSNGKWYSVTGTNALSNEQVKAIVEGV